MAGTKHRQQSSSLVTFGPNNLLKISILVFVIYVVNIEGQSIDDLVTDNLRVNEGDSAVLPCFFSPSNAAIDKWYWKTNGSVIIRSDDPPDTNSRYSLGDATSGNISLVIKEVLRWDKGTYTCGVNDQSTGSTDDCKLRVNYIDNPKIQALADTRVPEGSKVSMLCKTNSSYPEVNMIMWFHEGNIIDRDSGNYIFEDDILQIKEFDQSYEGKYSCRVENEFFTGRNGKYSNSIIFSLLRKEAIPPSSSQIWIVFIIIPVLIICVVVLAMYFLKKRSQNKHRFDDFIYENVIKRDQKNEINVERALDDFIPAEYKEKGYEEGLKFNVSVSTVARGECIKSCFNSTYNSEHFCFNCRSGYLGPFFTMLLHSCNWPENRLSNIYSSPDLLRQITGKVKDNGSHGSIKFNFELKRHFKYGATGYLIFNDITDDDEGYYIYLLQIKNIQKKSGCREEISHAFYGRTSIQLKNAIYRSNVYKRQFISPIGVVHSANQVHAFALKMEKEERKGQEEDKTILRYITCAGKLQSDEKNITIKWNDAAQVLLKPEEELLSFVALPGLYHSYIFIGYINISKDRRLLGQVFSFLPDGSFKLINNIVETLESEGPVDVLKFDPFSGKKLSSGRLVVGGWIKRVICNKGYQKRTRIDVLKLRFTGSTSSRSKLENVENQSYEYEPFIMWSDDEINWNLGGNLKIEEAVENMRIQVTETGNGKEVVVIISSLDSKKVLYEGHSKDYCATFTETTKDWHFKMPVVSFAIINGSLGGVSSMEYIEETSGQREAESSAKKGEGSSVNKMKESLLEIDKPANEETRTSALERSSEDTVELSFQNVPNESVSGKAASKENKTLLFSSRKSSTSKSAHKYERVPTIEIASIKNDDNDDSMGNVIKEGSPETNELTDDEKVSTLENLPQDSMEGSSGKVKKRKSLGNFGRILADRFSFSSKKAPSVSEQTTESENVSLTQECTFNKEGSRENTKTEGSSGTYKLTDHEQVMTTIEEPPEDSMEESSEKVKKRTSLGRFAKNVSNKLPTKSKGESSGSKLTEDYESASLTDEFNKEESTRKTVNEGSSESNKLPEDEQVMETMEEPPEYSMECTSEKVVKKQSLFGRLSTTASNKLLTKLKRESPGSKLTKESEIEIKSQIQDRSTWEGFWHLEEDTTNDKVIRLRPVKDNKGSSDTSYDFVTILENKSKVQCEQILPFTCKDESWFVMIYSTHFTRDSKDEKNYSLCTRYHVFSLQKVMGGSQ